MIEKWKDGDIITSDRLNDSQYFENGKIDLSTLSTWGYSGMVKQLLPDGSLLGKVSSATTESWGVRANINWDGISDVYVTINVSTSSNAYAVLVNQQTGELIDLENNTFSVYKTTQSNHRSYYIPSAVMKNKGFSSAYGGQLMMRMSGINWLNLKDFSISKKPGFSEEFLTAKEYSENIPLRFLFESGINQKLLSDATNVSNSKMDLITPTNYTGFTTEMVLQEVKIWSPKDTTVDLRVGTIDQNNLFVDNTRNIPGVSVKAGFNVIRYEKSNIVLKPGQRLFMNPTNVGMYTLPDTIPSFGKSLIRDDTHYINDGTYSGNQLYEVDNVSPFSYSIVEKNVYNKLNDVNAKVSTISNSVNDLLPLKDNLTIKGSSGVKYTLVIDENTGQVLAKSSIPTNVVAVGNSLTYNWGNFGLAASNPTKDWFGLAKAYILNVNPSAKLTRFGFGDWEGATTTTDRDNIFNTQMKPSLSAETDLVIIQLGDNINTSDKNATFGNDAKKLIQNIKSVSPKATIVWVATWYQSFPNITTDVEKACSDTGAVYVPIHSIAQQSGNTSHIGAVQTDAERNTRTIGNSGQASHPGDLGHQKIANVLLSKFDF